MATKIFALFDALATGSNGGQLDEPGFAQDLVTTTGVVVGTGSTNSGAFRWGVEWTPAWTDNTDPDGSLNNTADQADFLRTESPYSGTFASGDWTFIFSMTAITQGGAADGRVVFRLFKGASADGSDATEISAGQHACSVASNIGTKVESSLTFNPGQIVLDNEYLFVQIAWQRTGAGGMSTSDVHFSTGSSSSVGTRITTTNFTQAASQISGSSAQAFGAGSSTLLGRAPIVASSDLVFDDGASTLTEQPAAFVPPRGRAAMFAALAVWAAVANFQVIEYQRPGLITTPSAALAGSADIAFGGVGTLSGGAISGSSSIAFSNSGTLNQLPGEQPPPKHALDHRAAWSPNFRIVEHRRAGQTVEGAAQPPGDQPPPKGVRERALYKLQARWYPEIRFIILKPSGPGWHSDRSQIEGTAAISFSNAATLRGRIQGVATISFAATGNLKAEGAIYGSSALQFGGVGNLTGRAPITATANPNFGDGASTLKGRTQLAGTSALAFSGFLQPPGALAGTAELKFSNPAELHGYSYGSSALAFTTQGVAAGHWYIPGSVSVQFTNSATLTGFLGRMVGSADGVFEATGTLVAQGQMAGVCSMTFAAAAQTGEAPARNWLIDVNTGALYWKLTDPKIIRIS